MPGKNLFKAKSVLKGDSKMKAIPLTRPKSASLHTASKTACTHSRMVEDVVTAKGTKTGQLICKECQSIFPDPAFQKPAH